MIVGERKPFDEIKDKIRDYKKVLILGCGTCVSVCMAGGEKEVELLATQLRMANQLENKDVEIGEATIQRQCDREYIEPIVEMAKNCNAVLSMACGAGVQLVADMLEVLPVIPALNTSFVGVTETEGVWAEWCRTCGDCILDKTGGICPVVRCAKGLLNGPCGGTDKGKCEVDREKDCAWTLIYQRLEKQGKLDIMRKYYPPRNFQAVVRPGKITAE
ncbi:methylenetetrahydrofolate reductase C-terminal domain-containing protein [Chloroflexota bacterium]